MATIQLPIQTLHVALAIGLFDLFLSEAFNASVRKASSWRSRTTLFTTGVLFIPRKNQTPNQHNTTEIKKAKYNLFFSDRTRCFIVVAQLILLSLCLWLELSLSEKGFKFPRTIPEKCYRYERKTKLTMRRVPYTGALDDSRIPKYLHEAGCIGRNRLLREALARQTALYRGYPKCTNTTFHKVPSNKLTARLKLQGGGVGMVGTFLDGEPFLSYTVASVNKTDFGWGKRSGFAGTSFWSWAFQSSNSSLSSSSPDTNLFLGKSEWYWHRNHSFVDRIAANVQLPLTIMRDAPAEYSTDQIATIECDSRKNKTCFEQHARIAHELQKQPQTYERVRVPPGYSSEVQNRR